MKDKQNDRKPVFYNHLNILGSSTDIGICLTRIVIRHRAIEAHLRTLTRLLISINQSPAVRGLTTVIHLPVINII